MQAGRANARKGENAMMQIDANTRTTPKAPAMLAAGAIAAAVIAALLAFAPATAFADEPTSGGAKAKAAKPVEITISAVGDCTLL